MALDKDGKTQLPPNIYWREKQQLYACDKVYKGNRIMEYSKTLKGKDGIVTILRNRLYEIDHGIQQSQNSNQNNGQEETMTFDEAFHLYLAEWKPSLKRGTKRTYTDYYNYYIKEHLGDMRLDEITDKDIEALYKDWVEEEGFRQGTFDSARKLVVAVLNAAIKKRIIRENVCNLVDTPKNLPKKKQRVLTEEEQEIFLKYAKENSWYYEYYVTSLFIGARAGEVSGLCEDAVNYKKEEITIKRNLQYDDDGYYIETPKTPESARVIDLLPEAKQAIKKAIKKRDKLFAAIGKINIPKEFRQLDFIFVNSEGGLISKSTLAHDLDKIVALINQEDDEYEKVNPHALRHTFATLANEKGVNIVVLSETLGHTSLETTRRYVGIDRKFRRAETNKLSTGREI